MLRRFVPVLVVSLVLVACGSSPDPQSLVAATSEQTAEAGTARMWLESTVRGLPGAQGFTSTADGVVDFGARRGELSLRLPSELGQGEDLRFVYDGTVLYLQAPEALSDGGRTWISFDFAQLGEDISGADIEQLSQAGSNDPSNALALLNGASDRVEEIGTEEVRGEETTHYRAVVDLRKAAEQAGAVRDRRQFEAFLDQFPSETIPVEVWLDGEGRTRRMHIDQPMPDTPGVPAGPDAGVTTTIELYDFGVDEPIEVPPPDEVTDLTDEFSGLVDASTTTTTG